MECVVHIIDSGGAHVLGRANGDIASVLACSPRRRAKARTETQRMITEKVAALTEAQVAATVATLKGSKKHRVAKKALGVYARRVRRNRRRLAK